MTETKGKRITKAVLEDAFAELQDEKDELQAQHDAALQELEEVRALRDGLNTRLAEQGQQLAAALQQNAVLEQELGNGRLLELDVRRKLESARTLVGLYQQRFGESPVEGEPGGA